MLQNIRKHIQGWIAGVITAVIGLTFVFWGIQYGHVGSKKKDVLAQVAGNSITVNDVNAEYLQWKNSEEHRLKKPLTVDQQQQLKAMALQQLVSANVLYSFAKKQGFQVSIDQIKQVIMAEPEFQENGHFSPQRFQQILLANGIKSDQFFQQMQQAFTVRQVIDGIMLSSFALREELAKAYSLFEQKRDFDYLLLPAANFFQKSQPTPQQIDEYYQQHKQDFRTPERVKVSYLLLSPQEIAQSLSVDPAQEKQYYQSHLADFTLPMKWQIDSLVIQLPSTANDQAYQQAKISLEKLRQQSLQNKNITFSQLAKQNPGSQLISDQWVNADQMSDHMRQTLLNLKPGEISLPVYTRTGLAIVQVKSIKPGTTKDFDSAKLEIENLLKHQRVQEILNQKSEKLSEYTYTNPGTLSIAAKSLKLPIQTSDWITQSGEPRGLFSNKKLLATIFSQDILQQGNNSEPIELNNGSLIVVRVDAHRPSIIQPLSMVRPQIIQALQQQIAQNQAGLQAFKIQNALLSGASPENLAKQYNLTWQKEQNIARNNKTVPAPILSEVFNLVPTSQQSHPVTTALLTKGDYAIVQLQNIHLANYDAADLEEVDKLHNNLINYWGQTTYQLYMQDALANTKVKYNNQSILTPNP